MLDKKLESMLDTAATLTADDLDNLRSIAPADTIGMAKETALRVATSGVDVAQGESPDEHAPAVDTSPALTAPPAATTRPHKRATVSSAGVSTGEYERQRTRESKVSTACIGREREKHDWWPIGTTLVGRIGSETFTAAVVENTRVKSNRSLLITTGPANGRICVTPTRAAMEATETYRQTHNLGRGGGVTNGWEFWEPAS